MSLNQYQDTFSSTTSPQTDFSDPFSTSGKQYEEEVQGHGIEDASRSGGLHRLSLSTSESRKIPRFSMRIPIRVQLGLLVLITSLLALAVISIATVSVLCHCILIQEGSNTNIFKWVYTCNFVANIK